MSSDTTSADAPAKPKIPLVIGMVAVGLLLGVGSGALFVGPTLAKKMGKVAVPPPAHGDSTEEHGEGGEEGEHAEEKPKEGKEGEGAATAVHLIENLVLNPAGSGGSRFLLFSVAIELPNATVGDSFKSRDAELRDIILTAIGTKPVESLTDIAAREGFKKELEQAIKDRFGKKAVRRLYFPQFVVQ
jgi:flagellar FliL protein